MKRVFNRSLSNIASEEGGIEFYWLDAVFHHKRLTLFGKVFNRNSQEYESCSVDIGCILRSIYFLPESHINLDNETDQKKLSSEIGQLMKLLFKYKKSPVPYRLRL